MPPTPSPLRPASALGLYLRALGGGLRGLLWRAGGATGVARATEASAAAAESRGLGRLQRGAGVAAAVLAVLCLWVLVADGVAFEVAGVEVSMRNPRNPSKLLLVATALWLVLRDLRSGRWAGPRGLAALGRAGLATRVGVLAWVALVVGLSSAVNRVGEALDTQARRARRARGSSLYSNSWHKHMPLLVEAVAGRAPEPEVAVFIEDTNPRGHLVTFYTYPRLLRMEPAQHAWSLAEMMCVRGEDDPGFERPARRPDLEETLRWADERGLDVLVASPEGADVVAAEGGQ